MATSVCRLNRRQALKLTISNRPILTDLTDLTDLDLSSPVVDPMTNEEKFYTNGSQRLQACNPPTHTHTRTKKIEVLARLSQEPWM